jgi:hypothetical protein
VDSTRDVQETEKAPITKQSQKQKTHQAFERNNERNNERNKRKKA